MAPPSTVPVAPSPSPDAYWYVEKLAEASLLAGRDPVTQHRTSARGAPPSFYPSAELLRAFHNFIATLSGAAAPTNLAETVAVASASRDPVPAATAKDVLQEAHTQTPSLAVRPAPIAPADPSAGAPESSNPSAVPAQSTGPARPLTPAPSASNVSAQSNLEAGADEEMIDDAGGVDAPPEEVDCFLPRHPERRAQRPGDSTHRSSAPWTPHLREDDAQGRPPSKQAEQPFQLETPQDLSRI